MKARVYLITDVGNRLLWVGCTYNLDRRLSQHRAEEIASTRWLIEIKELRATTARIRGQDKVADGFPAQADALKIELAELEREQL